MSEERIIDLEIRLSHLEASIEELTKTVLQQQNEIGLLTSLLEQQRTMLNELSPSAVAHPSEETLPPHY